MEKIHQSSSGNQVYPIFPGAVFLWQWKMADVLYLKWTVPCRPGENRAKNLLFSWAVLQVKSLVMARIHQLRHEGVCAWDQEHFDCSWSLLVWTRKTQVQYSLLVGFVRLLRQKSPPSTGLLSRYMKKLQYLQSWCFTASDKEHGKEVSSVLFPCPGNRRSEDFLKDVIHWRFYSIAFNR